VAKAEDLGVDDVYDVLVTTFDLSGDTNKGQFRCLCPVHEAGEEGHRPSCDVDLETGYWNCFSCPAAGDLVDLGVVLHENIPFDRRIVQNKSTKKSEMSKEWLAARARIHQILKPNTPDAVTMAIKRRLSAAKKALRTQRAPTKAPWKPIIPSESSYSTKIPKALIDRGFTKETIRRWNIRYAKRATLLKEDGKSFTITNAIAIPIYSRKKILIGWCYRATDKSEKWFRNVRYIYTPGITDVLSHLWFGMHMHKDSPEITVVEGALDAIWCDQNGIPAVAILGSQVKQIPKLRELMDFRKVTLFCDRDTSGATTAHLVGEALQERGVPCTVCLFQPWMRNRRGEQAKDAQDLCPLDIELTHAGAIPFLVWKRSLAS
jgi:DNA primase